MAVQQRRPPSRGRRCRRRFDRDGAQGTQLIGESSTAPLRQDLVQIDQGRPGRPREVRPMARSPVADTSNL